MRMRTFFGNRRSLPQFGVDGTVGLRERMDDFLGNVFSDDFWRIACSIGVFENESRFGRFDHLSVGRSRKEQTASGDDNQTGGEGTDFRHKERHLSSRL